MRNLAWIRLLIIVSMGLMIGGSVGAEDYWGNSGASPTPTKDISRSNHWWWPTTVPSDIDSTRVWGNGGRVFGKFTPPPPPAAPEPRRVTPPPPAASAPVARRTTPVFNSVLFGFDSASLSPNSASEIDKIVSILKDNAGDNIVIEGHTDNVNRSGNPNYNVELGQRRADSVRDAIVNSGVVSSRVKAVSMGDSSPAIANNSRENRAMNRRVVFVYSINE